MKLHLVRHPRPDVAPGLCYGASDVAVRAPERDHVRALLAAAHLPRDLPVYASPLRRCAELAASLDARRLRLDARLAEMDFGSWELRPWAGIARADVDAWAADLLHYRPGGGDNVLAVARRVAGFLADVRVEAGADGAGAALVVCHAGTMRLMMALASGAPLEQAALHAAQTPHRIGYGEIVVLEY